MHGICMKQAFTWKDLLWYIQRRIFSNSMVTTVMRISHARRSISTLFLLYLLYTLFNKLNDFDITSPFDDFPPS